MLIALLLHFSVAVAMEPAPDHGFKEFPEPSAEGWQLIDDSDGCRSYKRTLGDSGVVAFRGERRLPAPIARVTQVLLDGERKKEWIDQATEAHTIERETITERWEYVKMHVPWPFQDREIIYHGMMIPDAKKHRLFISLKSGPHPKWPERSSVVRAKVLRSTYWLIPAENGTQTDMIMEAQVDPGGAIPKWIVNMVQKNWARRTFNGIAKQLQNPTVKENADVRQLIGLKPIPDAVRLPAFVAD
jgi:hypothetical protein